MPLSGNLLVGIRIKKTAKVDLSGPILKFIQSTYGPSVAEDAKDDLEAIQQLRNSIQAAASSPGIGIKAFASYFRALNAIESRFPISSDPTQICIQFTWWDSFKESYKATQKNIHFEKCAILFCLASINSQVGIDAQRTEQSGMQEACQSFCAAAGLFAYLRDNVTIKTDQPRPVDISGECCSMMERLMLSQAQEVFYELVCARGTAGASMAAAIAKQVAVLYYETAALFQRPAIVAHFDKTWLYNARAKAIMYDAEAALQQAYLERREKRHKEFVGRLRHAVRIFDEHKKELKLANPELQRHAKAVEDRVRQELVKGEDDNLKIYMDVIPDPANLPPIVGKMLVSAKVPEYIHKGDEKWFSDIVPDRVAKALSRYTEEMDGTVRGMLQKLEGATDEARLALVQYGLPEALDSLNPARKANLPEDLKMAFADDFISQGGMHHLRGLAKAGAELRAQVEAQLKHCAVILDGESSADAAMRAKWKADWRRPSSNVLDAPLRETISRYEANLRAAAESDGRVHARLTANERRLSALAPEQAATRMPALQPPMVNTGGADPATVVNNLRGALAVLSQLGQQRAAIEEKIKDTRDKDNVLPELLSNPNEEPEAIFRRSLAKYQSHATDVDTNTHRQADLMRIIAQNMAAFKSVYDLGAWEQECKAVADEIKRDIATGHELLSNLKEGIEFYSGLSEAVKSLSQMCSDYALTRSINAEELDQDLTQKQSVVSANEAAARQMRDDEQRRQQAAQDLAAMKLNNAQGTAPPPQRPSDGGGAPNPAPYPPQQPQYAQQQFYGAYPQHPPGPSATAAPNASPAGPYSHAYPQQPHAPPQPYYYQPPPGAPVYGQAPPGAPGYGHPPPGGQYYQQPPYPPQ